MFHPWIPLVAKFTLRVGSWARKVTPVLRHLYYHRRGSLLLIWYSGNDSWFVSPFEIEEMMSEQVSVFLLLSARFDPTLIYSLVTILTDAGEYPYCQVEQRG